jgi:hypothetical protein
VYQFAGFFARPPVSPPNRLPDDAVWRDVTVPFAGVGVRLPALLGKAPPAPEVMDLARRLGIDRARDWLFIVYDCWGGRIDYVYGLGTRDGQTFGPTEESAIAQVEGEYVVLMEQFGVLQQDALHFAPFERGYWGEA